MTTDGSDWHGLAKREAKKGDGDIRVFGVTRGQISWLAELAKITTEDTDYTE